MLRLQARQALAAILLPALAGCGGKGAETDYGVVTPDPAVAGKAATSAAGQAPAGKVAAPAKGDD